MKIKDAKIGHYYGIAKIKSVIVPKKMLETGRVLVLNLVTSNELDVKGDYEVDGELTKEQAEALLGTNQTVAINRATAENKNDVQKAAKAKKKEQAEANLTAAPASPTADADAAPDNAEAPAKRVLHKPKTASGLGKCALIDKLIIEGGHTMAEIVELVAADLGVTDEAGKKAIKSTAGVRPVHVKKAGYEIIKDAAGKISVKKI